MAKFKLRNLKVDRIALANAGANQHAHILLAKNKDEDCDDEMMDDKEEMPFGRKKKMKEEVEKSISGILDAVTTGLKDAEILKDSATTEDFRDILPPDTLISLETVIKSALSANPLGEQMDIQELVDSLPEEVVSYVTELETQVETLTKSLEEAKATPEPPVEDPIAKTLASLPSEAQEILKSMTARVEKAEAELEAARVAKATESWIAKVRALDGAIENPEELGTTLREIADHKPELAEAVEKALKVAAERVSKGDLFKELGTSGPATTDVQSRIEAIAKTLREADPKLTPAAAMAEAWTSNPDLYDQYQQEKRLNR